MVFSSAPFFILLLVFFLPSFASVFSYSCRFTWDNEHVHIWTVVQLIIMFSLHHSYSKSDDNYNLLPLLVLGELRNERIQQFVNYISDLETR